MKYNKTNITNTIREPIKSIMVNGKEEKLTLIGQGATCLVYINENETAIYKEFYPVLNGYIPALYRNESGELVKIGGIDQNVILSHAYQKSYEGFRNSINVANKIYETYKAKNADMRIYPIECEASHGIWQKFNANRGDVYYEYLNKIRKTYEEKFFEYFAAVVFSICLMTRDVGTYHNAIDKEKYINFDIKPQNMYILYNDANRVSAVRNLDFGSTMDIPALLNKIMMEKEMSGGDVETVIDNIHSAFFSTTDQFYYERTLDRAIRKCVESDNDEEKINELIRLDAIAVLKILIYALSGDLDTDNYIVLGDEYLHLKGKLRKIFANNNVTGSKNLFREYNCYFHLYELITYVFVNQDGTNMMAEIEKRLLDILCILGKRPGTEALTQRQQIAIAQDEVFAAANEELAKRRLESVDDICDFADKTGLWIPASPAELNYYFTVGCNREDLRNGIVPTHNPESWSEIVKNKIDLRLFPDVICDEKVYSIYDESVKQMKESAEIPLIRACDEIDGKKRILVIGNASQGKSTSLKIFAAEQTYRGKLCLFYPCRDFRNERDFNEVESLVSKVVSEEDTAQVPVLVFDAYDELEVCLRSDFLNMLSSLDGLNVDIVISSRYDFADKKQNDELGGFADEWGWGDTDFRAGAEADINLEGAYMEADFSFLEKYTHIQMLPFNYEQLDSIVDKSINRTDEYFKLLETTMLLVMHTKLEKANIYGKIGSNIKTEVAFIKRYFASVAVKKKGYSYDDAYLKLGEYIYNQRNDISSGRCPTIPDYLKDIMFYRKVGKRKELDAINLKYLNFFEANYIMEKYAACLDNSEDFCSCSSDYHVVVLKHTFMPQTDETNEVLYYVGQLLSEKGYDEERVLKLFSTVSRSYSKIMKCAFILGYCHGEARDTNCEFKFFDKYSPMDPNPLSDVFIRSHIRAITAPSFGADSAEFCKEGLPMLERIAVNNDIFKSEGNCLIKRKSGEVWLGCNRSVIPNGVFIIRKNAFSYCSQLTEINVPDSVECIDSLAFKRCDALERVEIGRQVKRIHEAAFYYCKNLRKVIFKKSDMRIDDRDGCHSKAFEGSNNIDDMTLPTTALMYPYLVSNNEVKTIRIFQGYEYGMERALSFTDIPRFNNTRELYIAADVSEISDDAFYKRFNCYEKIEVEEGNGKYFSVNNCLIERRSKCLMLGCKNSIIPDDGSVKEIGGYAFATVDGLKSVEIGEHIEQIGEYAFAGCGDLEVVDVKKNLKYIGMFAFSFKGSLKNVRIADADAWSQIFFSNVPSNPVCFSKKLELPKEVDKTVKVKPGRTKISAGAFRYARGFEKLVIPSTLKEIGGTAFLECFDLKDVYIEDLKAWCGITFRSYSANPLSNHARLWLGEEQVRDLSIGKDIEKIEEKCFVCCKDLESVSFEGDVEIGGLAFDACEDLKKVTFKSPNVKIEEDAFSKCAVDVYFCGTPEQWNDLGGNMLLGINNVFFEA